LGLAHLGPLQQLFLIAYLWISSVKDYTFASM
jgi:hypothetical protein